MNLLIALVIVVGFMVGIDYAVTGGAEVYTILLFLHQLFGK